MSGFEYKNGKKIEYRRKSEEILDRLPPFCRTYERGIEGTVSALTMYEYLQRISVFFRYLSEENSRYEGRSPEAFEYSDLDALTPEDVEDFAHFLRTGSASDGSENKETSVNHYLCALNSLLDYLLLRGKISRNAAKSVKRGKRPKREPIVLEADDEDGFFRSVVYGTNLSAKTNECRNDAVVARDYAVCLTLIRTGLRVSELVGLDLDDVDMIQCRFRVNRKGDKINDVYFSDSVKEALAEYMTVRRTFSPSPEEKALFLVSVGKYKGKRLSVRSVQLLVKKYAVAGMTSDGSKITPHKMRSTYATNLLRASGADLTLVQEALSHESPSTTSIYLRKRTQDLKDARNVIDEND